MGVGLLRRHHVQAEPVAAVVEAPVVNPTEEELAAQAAAQAEEANKAQATLEAALKQAEELADAQKSTEEKSDIEVHYGPVTPEAVEEWLKPIGQDKE